MKLKIDVDIGELSEIEFFCLYCINYNIDSCCIAPIIHSDLINKKYIIYIQAQDRYILTAKAKKLFNSVVNINIEELAQKLIDLAPKGVKSGDFPVKSGKKDVIDKLNRFFIRYSSENFTPEEITEATKLYFSEKEMSNWYRISTLKHYIVKKPREAGSEEYSLLNDYCLRYRQRNEEYIKQQDKVQIQVKDF